MEDQPTYIGGKSGRGATHGVVSELTAFLDVEPGKADELREGLKRFHIRVRNAPWDVVQKIGIVDMKHVVFDDGTRLCWNTAFDTDWDPSTTPSRSSGWTAGPTGCKTPPGT